jgi:hypothetical protein
MTNLVNVTQFEKSIRIDAAGRSQTVVLDEAINQTLVVGDVIIVRLEPQPGKVLNENVIGIGQDGKLMWRIQATPHVYDDSPYTNVTVMSDGSIWASNWDGASHRVDHYSGAVLETRLGK